MHIPPQTFPQTLDLGIQFLTQYTLKILLVSSPNLLLMYTFSIQMVITKLFSSSGPKSGIFVACLKSSHSFTPHIHAIHCELYFKIHRPPIPPSTTALAAVTSNGDCCNSSCLSACLSYHSVLYFQGLD